MAGDELQGILQQAFDPTSRALKIATGAGSSGASGIAAYPGGGVQASSTKSGSYCVLGGSSGTGAPGTGSLRVQPVYFPKAVTITRIGAEVTTAGASGALVRLGIWNDTGDLYPGTVLLDAGTIDGTSQTVQEITISQALSAGVYWFGAVPQAQSSTLRIVANPVFASGHSSNVIVSGNSFGYLDTQTGALATFTTTPNGVVGTVPRVFWKIA